MEPWPPHANNTAENHASGTGRNVIACSYINYVPTLIIRNTTLLRAVRQRDFYTSRGAISLEIFRTKKILRAKESTQYASSPREPSRTRST